MAEEGPRGEFGQKVAKKSTRMFTAFRAKKRPSLQLLGNRL
jgi:hypothetical protein